uniref:(northern house mosquito) hypothetical protein n=1 Tax=Culex pipiens TaxID=7175 RepID=A0A8D8ADP3_CULPI
MLIIEICLIKVQFLIHTNVLAHTTKTYKQKKTKTNYLPIASPVVVVMAASPSELAPTEVTSATTPTEVRRTVPRSTTTTAISWSSLPLVVSKVVVVVPPVAASVER